MIRLTRPKPPKGYAKRAREALAQLEAVAAAGGYKAQRRFEFDSSVWAPAQEVLAEASDGKCAYCETEGAGSLSHFRPLLRAEGADKRDVHPDHYWWLAYAWDNLVYACDACERAKRNRFPVRARRAERGEALSVEQPLLLDPYADDPSEHLHAEDDGVVRPLSDRGEATINVLALNRPELLSARRGMVRSLVRPLLAEEVSAVWIEEVELVNFGPIRELVLDFAAPRSGQEPWIVLLGANGAGKSTVLKAIALALTSASQRRRLVRDASRYLNRATRSDRGLVRLRFNQGDEIRLRFRRGEKDFTVDGRRPDFPLVGYGSTRLLPEREVLRAPRSMGRKLLNLFDPWAPLAHAEKWLADPAFVDSDDFVLLCTSLKTLLSVEGEVKLQRRRGRLRASLPDGVYDLKELSAGYQSILALSLDLALAMGHELRQGFSTENFEGMVLIDELEVHLHPEWRMRVVSDLRSIFPHLQFVATTHDPLCLRGLEPGEVHLLQRIDDWVTVAQIDVPPGLDADEILTGSWFGLETTLDAQVEQDLLRYRKLRVAGSKPDAPELADLQRRLEATLGSYSGTSIGRVMIEAAGELLHEQPAADRRKLSTEAVKQRLVAHARRVGG